MLDPSAIREDAIWVYLGESEECLECEKRKLCHGSMFAGTMFQVVRRKGVRSYCRLRECEVESVQIRKPDVTLALDARVAKEGAIIEFVRVSCGEWACPYRELCDPMLLADRERIRVAKVERTFPCPVDSSKVLCVARATPV